MSPRRSVEQPRALRYAVRRGAYHDSLVLMGLHAALARQPGILDAGATMASRTNLELLAATDLLPEMGAAGEALSGGDLLVVVAAESAEAGDAALDRLDELLCRRSEVSDRFRPRSLAGALRQLPRAGWAAISVPGQYAAALARDALHLDLDVFLYSDNVPLDQEVGLKRLAAERGRLVLGPDCGSALVDGIGLGFTNRVRQGGVGLIAASGTGLQAVSVALDRLGSGVSQAIGTGGRDLSSEVGGATAHRALDRLAADPETEVVVLISKRPAPEVAESLLEQAEGIGKPVVVYFQAAGSEDVTGRGRERGCWMARSLEQAAATAHDLATGHDSQEPADLLRGTKIGQTEVRGYLRGLFGGGTLAAETLGQLSPYLDDLRSNLDSGNDAPVRRRSPGIADSSPRLDDTAHVILDLGDDELTRGRPHPMIDPAPQAEGLRREGANPRVRVILFDVVLGDGAHRDPAAVLAPAVREALDAARDGERELEVIALVIGTESDPQGLEGQIEQFEEAGAIVVRSVEEAIGTVLEGVGGVESSPSGGRRPVRLAPGSLRASKAPPLHEGELSGGSRTPTPAVGVINVGLETFYDSLASRGVPAVHVDWRPPAGGDERLAGIIERLKEHDREAGDPKEAMAP